MEASRSEVVEVEEDESEEGDGFVIFGTKKAEERVGKMKIFLQQPVWIVMYICLYDCTVIIVVVDVVVVVDVLFSFNRRSYWYG